MRGSVGMMRVCMCMFVRVCMYVCVCMYVFMYVCVCMYTRVCKCLLVINNEIMNVFVRWKIQLESKQVRKSITVSRLH